MFQIISFSIISLILVLFLKENRPEYAVIVSAAAGCILMVLIIIKVYPFISDILEYLNEYSVDGELSAYLLKSLGICYITKFASEMCKDFGQTGLSSKVEMAGRATVFILTVPLIKNILSIGLSMI